MAYQAKSSRFLIRLPNLIEHNSSDFHRGPTQQPTTPEGSTADVLVPHTTAQPPEIPLSYARGARAAPAAARCFSF